jgi:magnesium chelatase family protein
MLARCNTASLQGLSARPVVVEVDIGPGLPALALVGLADTAVQEARERVRAALRHSGFRMPQGRVVVNLAPADLRKEGPGFDLPVALGLLQASGQLRPEAVDGVWSCAELGLDGSLRPVRGLLPLALQAKRQGARALLVAPANGQEAALVEGLRVWVAHDLAAAVVVLQSGGELALPQGGSADAGHPGDGVAMRSDPAPDLAEVRGQLHGRRALAISAAGGHHLLLVGPPGSGKTMLAQRLAGLLPPLSHREALELTEIQSVAGLLQEQAVLAQQRPFRAPHHSCSGAALIGGGSRPRPGELSLAHHGVLFLDELGEFRPGVLDLLRQPLEEGEVRLQRSRQSCRFPCRITLVAATNPCRCGWYGDPERDCRCSEAERLRYWGRLSGPLLDRLDLQVVMRRPPAAALAEPFRRHPEPAGSKIQQRVSATLPPPAASSAAVAETVARAHRRMAHRNPGGHCNARLNAAALQQVLQLEPMALELWEKALEQRRLSGRAAERVLRVALTISDLEDQRQVGAAAIAEALTYRSFDQPAGTR